LRPDISWVSRPLPFSRSPAPSLSPPQSGRLQSAGVGWEPGIVGKATVGADLESPAGFALQTGQPVISNHLENEQRFRTPELLVRHGIHRAINVILQGDGRHLRLAKISRVDRAHRTREGGGVDVLVVLVPAVDDRTPLRACASRWTLFSRSLRVQRPPPTPRAVPRASLTGSQYSFLLARRWGRTPRSRERQAFAQMGSGSGGGAVVTPRSLQATQ
jgi:hypothetical protein